MKERFEYQTQCQEIIGFSFIAFLLIYLFWSAPLSFLIAILGFALFCFVPEHYADYMIKKNKDKNE